MKPGHVLRIIALSAFVGLASLALPLSAHAGVHVSLDLPLPGPAVVVPPPPAVVVPPPPAVVYPSPVVVGTGYYGYHGYPYRYWRHHYRYGYYGHRHGYWRPHRIHHGWRRW